MYLLIFCLKKNERDHHRPILQVGKWVFHSSVAKQTHNWKERGYHSIPMWLSTTRTLICLSKGLASKVKSFPEKLQWDLGTWSAVMFEDYQRSSRGKFLSLTACAWLTPSFCKHLYGICHKVLDFNKREHSSTAKTLSEWS